MVKILFIILFSISLFANSFNTNCLSCHKNKQELKLFMAKYTLKYSSENNIKKALFRFLKSPTSNKSIMPFSYIKKVGYKDDSTLNDKELKEAIDTYYKQYKLKNFIR